MKKSIKFLLIILIFTSCSNSDGALLKGIKRKVIEQADIAQKNGKEYSLYKMSSVTDFEWDRFFVLEEYVTNNQINEITGINWKGTDVPNGCRRILFINRNEIVRYVDFQVASFPLWIFTCKPVNQQSLILKKDDLFVVFKSPKGNSFYYGMIPFKCAEGMKRFYQKKN